MPEKIKIVAAAFGNPRSEKVQSGVSKYLFSALEKYADITGYISTKKLRPWDAFEGALDILKMRTLGRPGLNVNWMWRNRTLEKLSARFERSMSQLGEFDAVVQVGTNVCVRRRGVRHYCRTDMTIVQGAKSKQFSVAKLNGRQLKEAIETQRRIFENCHGIFAVSSWAGKSIVDDYGIDPGKVHLVGAGASLADNVSIKTKDAAMKILFIGRNWERKGGVLLLEAFQRVKKQISDAHLTIIGCCPDIKDNNVTVLGELDKSDPEKSRQIEEVIRQSDILCVPSSFEPLGICFLESQFYGAVPVTFDGEGRGEAIRDGITGVLVPERSSQALSEALLALLKNPDDLRRMSLAGQKYVRENFTWDSVAQKIVSIIEADINK